MIESIRNFFAWIFVSILAVKQIIVPVSPSPVPSPIPTPSEVTMTTPTGSVFPTKISDSSSITPQDRTTKKKEYVIVLLGDSMIDTLGPDTPLLNYFLDNRYPQTTFTIWNYGVGATDIDYGLKRITEGYTYLGKSYESLSSKKPDIVVVESFAYNPFNQETGALDRHWLALSAIVDSLRKNIPGVKIVIASTIAPNSTVFADGAPGIILSADEKKARTDTIKKYLNSTVSFAKSQALPLADAYHASMDSAGEGKIIYINPDDHIHYSEAGRKLISQKIADAITSQKL